MSNHFNAPEWLTKDLTAQSLYFSSQQIQLRAELNERAVRHRAPVSTALVKQLFAKAHEANIENPVLFGLIPFNELEPASFTIPATYQQTATPNTPPIATAEQQRPSLLRQQPVPAPERYADAVRAALKLYAAGGVSKIVLARAMDVFLSGQVNYQSVLEDLIRRNRQGYNFSLPIWGESLDHGGNMLAASPELLVRREGTQIFVNPLAGSIGRHEDPTIDEQRRAGLAISEKDLREHAYVVEDIVRNLKPYCATLNVPSGPSVIGTDALWHLSTYITGELHSEATTALELSCALHPTPAICGHPTPVAFEHILSLEEFDRDYFAGLAGWQNEQGDGEWALTLRCAWHDLNANKLRLYAGAGTVAGSDPDSETLETATKMETFRRAIV